MKILVIGASGYLGRRTVAALRRRNCDVIGADLHSNREFTDLRLDVRLPEEVIGAMATVKPTIVINMAYLLSESITERADDAIRTNVLGVNTIFASAVALGIPRVINMGSMAVYGDQLDIGEGWVTESSPLRPATTYGWMKALNESMAADYDARSMTHFITVRCSNCYGLTGSGAGFNPIGRLLAAQGKTDRILLPWSADHVTSLLHVDDAAEAVALIASADEVRWRVYNTGGEPVRLGDLDRTVGKILGITIECATPGLRVAHPGRISDERLRVEFGFRRRSLPEGIL